jgi:hypothetical protein
MSSGVSLVTCFSVPVEASHERRVDSCGRSRPLAMLAWGAAGTIVSPERVAAGGNVSNVVGVAIRPRTFAGERGYVRTLVEPKRTVEG